MVQTTRSTTASTARAGHRTPLEFLAATVRHPGKAPNIILQVCERGRSKNACAMPLGRQSTILIASYARHEPAMQAEFICHDTASLLEHLRAESTPRTVGNIVRHMHMRDILEDPMDTARMTSLRYAGLYAWVAPHEHAPLLEGVFDEVAFLAKTLKA